jgi:hypothetical protein
MLSIIIALLMQHRLSNSFPQQRFFITIRDLCTDKRVDVFWRVQLVMVSQKKYEMYMRQPPVLKFDNKAVCFGLTQNVVFDNVMQEFEELGMEDTHTEISSLGLVLMMAGVLSYFWPVRIASDNKKKRDGGGETD